MTLRIVRLGAPRSPDEGLRIGTVRRPPRGVPKEEFASRDFYDVWMPLLSPTPELVKQAQTAQAEHDEKGWQTFVRHFRAEMRDGDAARTLDMLAALSHQTNLSVGCYCEEEAHCHRSVLRELLKERGAKVAD
ncbi:hypothetical protein ACS15_5765 [Ralstonia insidiosa]|uniref:DUF488 domain-containing protein n=1 Tax=Ralstonia insidiosa TaxID=190721 RepID=A0AAC9FU89_9RALS|nr:MULTISPECIES: DUF488 family protein [Ralstonia]ANH76659.1 hypothetical protein ACS15_5765 [Ralstonia insidiosa]EPX99957.1 hypothetical protein C404_02000 [Ralstonia sp. AU12-08]MBY4705328.1 DUF488 family protein [Ralstonia insidiosa]GAQ29453.1 hypothetical protein SAMD00023378_3136 [Ralstonia sp. NT80]